MGGEGELFGERRAALWEGIVGYRREELVSSPA